MIQFLTVPVIIKIENFGITGNVLDVIKDFLSELIVCKFCTAKTVWCITGFFDLLIIMQELT